MELYFLILWTSIHTEKQLRHVKKINNRQEMQHTTIINYTYMAMNIFFYICATSNINISSGYVIIFYTMNQGYACFGAV